MTRFGTSDTNAVVAVGVKLQDGSICTSGNSQLLIDYREALIQAYRLGEDIKGLYGIVPPKALYDAEFPETTHRLPSGYPTITIGLTVN
jgi:hypothetical protein